ncbi:MULTISPECIES: hypothetical protein [Vibrio]|uniref:hypothetical protein n=1 Tax=Vibrio TaxID=662 RepID=UPI00193CBB4A|nr:MULTISPECIES: hypothetical protein [Vibrio]HAS6087803.1 hypothetical protein [Vibrio vulnificus]EKI0737908.1 hypothetical protein [Vibrio parahaemolyticus]MBM5036755.1 hypothetical protein [Vibrio parahaemolyticus]MBM5050412.1 hypothetical protein [Vibrio parahaemolyticus]MBM5077858.1 hypothetical protein [Vibrio parahaemolyticus]
MTGSLSLICINNPNEFRMVQRQQKKTVQAATADLLATAALLEKALDGNLDDETHALINAAYFQVNQVQTTFDKLVAQIDNIQLEDQSRE